MKKVISGILGLSASMILLIIGLLWFTFSGNAPLKQKSEFTPTSTQIKDSFVSVGIIRSSPSDVILIDCGNDEKATAILDELKHQKLGPEAVKAIFLTHGHADHYKGCSVFPRAAIFAMKSEQPLLEGKVSSRGPVRLVMPKRPAPIMINHYLNDGETTTLGSQTVSAYLIPGHTDGSGAYLVDGVLYLGDSADSNRSGKLTPAKWLVSNDVEQNRASLKDLAHRLAPQASLIKFLEFAHSAPIPGLQPLLDFANH